MQNELKHTYEDILDRPHHVSGKHPRMSMRDRAAQFSPFAALTGHGAAIRETERLTERRIDPDEDEREILDRKLRMLQGLQEARPKITICYFKPDERKEGGAYVTYTGRLKKIDAFKRSLIFEDKTELPIGQVVAMDGEMFES